MTAVEMMARAMVRYRIERNPHRYGILSSLEFTVERVDAIVDMRWHEAKHDAVAALQAIRVPTEGMLEAMRSVDFIADGQPDELGEWQAAIDFAIAEHQSGEVK